MDDVDGGGGQIGGKEHYPSFMCQIFGAKKSIISVLFSDFYTVNRSFGLILKNLSYKFYTFPKNNSVVPLKITEKDGTNFATNAKR